MIAIWLPGLFHSTARMLGNQSSRGEVASGIAACLLPVGLATLLPIEAALPAAAWAGGLMLLIWGVLASRSLLFGDTRVVRWLRRVGASRWELPAVASMVLALSLAATWPLVSRLTTALPGWPADNFAFLYKFWWFRTAILVDHRSPFFDPNTFSPFGFNLGQGEPTLANIIPGLIPDALFGDVAAYNVMAILSFVISGVGGYLLVRQFTGSKQAGLLGAVAFSICPYRMSQFAGHIQLLGTGWIVLAFYFTERVLSLGRWRDGLFAGFCFALAALRRGTTHIWSGWPSYFT